MWVVATEVLAECIVRAEECNFIPRQIFGADAADLFDLFEGFERGALEQFGLVHHDDRGPPFVRVDPDEIADLDDPSRLFAHFARGGDRHFLAAIDKPPGDRPQPETGLDAASDHHDSLVGFADDGGGELRIDVRDRSAIDADRAHLMVRGDRSLLEGAAALAAVADDLSMRNRGLLSEGRWRNFRGSAGEYPRIRSPRRPAILDS